jgi:hypothetical protein
VFGAAGFSRHALHHWDSGIHYTCFPAFEVYLAGTLLKSTLESRSTTYAEIFARLFRFTWA